MLLLRIVQALVDEQVNITLGTCLILCQILVNVTFMHTPVYMLINIADPSTANFSRALRF